jgi:hypothetical protein
MIFATLPNLPFGALRKIMAWQPHHITSSPSSKITLAALKVAVQSSASLWLSSAKSYEHLYLLFMAAMLPKETNCGQHQRDSPTLREQGVYG